MSKMTKEEAWVWHVQDVAGCADRASFEAGYTAGRDSKNVDDLESKLACAVEALEKMSKNYDCDGCMVCRNAKVALNDIKKEPL